MKKLTAFISAILIFGTNVSANEQLIDVFEEYADFDDYVCTTGGITIETLKNTSVTGKFIIDCDREFKIEIVRKPKLGKIEILSERGEYIYTPFKDRTGNDSFSYRIISDGIMSNISTVSVKIISDSQAVSVATSEFYYADMTGRAGDYHATKLAQLDVMRGEKIGEEYYFYPDSFVTRNSAIAYINSALGIDNTSVDKEKSDIFYDCKNAPYQIKKNAYIAYSTGIIKGIENDGKLYLYPDEFIERAEFLSMIDRAIGGKSFDTEILMRDKHQIPDYAKASIKNLSAYNIIENTKNTKLRPCDKITKEEMAELLYKLIEYKEENTVKTLSGRIKEEVYGKIVS